jgi:hypothetical protein
VNAALDIPRKLMPFAFNTMVSLSVAIRPYVRNIAMSIDMGIERRRIDGCKYINILTISTRSAPLPIKSRVSLTNFSMKRIIEREKIITDKFFNNSFSMVL